MEPASAAAPSAGRTDGLGRPAVSFDDDLEPLHRRIDLDAHEDVYVIGDVHGCIAELHDLLAVLDPARDDLLVFVGDLVRKGPDSQAVLDLVLEAPNMVSVRGNNEQKVLDGNVPAERFETGPDRLRELPAAISFGDALVVHGGVDPRRSLAEHHLLDVLETRAIPPANGYDGPFWFDRHEGPPRVFFGHTVLSEPVDRNWAVGLDTGCVYGGELTAYDYHAEEFVSVPAREPYRSRDADSIVDPTAP